MQSYRRNCVNEAEAEIKQVESCISRNKATIERFKRDLALVEKVEQLREKIERDEFHVEQLAQRIQDIQKGLLDDEIMDEINATTDRIRQQEELKSQAREGRIQLKSDKQKKLDQYYKEQKQSDREQRLLQKDYRYSYNYFEKICSTVPDYIHEKLNKMPSNRGYLWRGVWLLGKQRPDPAMNGIVVLTERKNKDLLLIYEYDKHETRVYEKHGMDKKLLKKTIPRRVR